MHIPLALLVEHDLVDYVNAASTVVIALFTVVTGIVVARQLKASKDIERAWVTLELTKDPMNAMMLCEGTSVEGDKKSVTTTALLQLRLKNDGNGPVWVKQLLVKMTLIDSLKSLPRKPEFDNEKDDQHWYPPAFVEHVAARFRVETDGSIVAKNHLVVYGKVAYQDKFQEDRFSTFGYVIHAGKSELERLAEHPEYNRNT